ncbi:MAG: AI-2E family transporter [Candidatus Melainabacteria bacterium]|nr:AI-2E family transporter [Candidatus Melainabacteria bacterium]
MPESSSVLVRVGLPAWAWVLLAVTTTVLLLLALLQLALFMYSIVATLGLVLVLVYILYGPVQVLDACLNRLPWQPNWSLEKPTPGKRGRIRRRLFGFRLRVLSVVVVVVFFLMLLHITLVQLVPALFQQWQDFNHSLPRYVNQAQSQLIDWSDQWLGADALKSLFQEDLAPLSPTVSVSPSASSAAVAVKKSAVLKPAGSGRISLKERQVIQHSIQRSAVSRLSVWLSQWLRVVLQQFSAFVNQALLSVLYVLAGGLMVFYALLDGERLTAGCLRLLPTTSRKPVRYFLGSVHEVMLAFIKGQVLLGALTGVYMFCVYSVFGIKYALLLAFVFFLAEILPVVGTWLGITPGLVVALFSGNPMNAFYVWLCSYLYQTVKDNILAPKVVGDVMGLHPLVVIISLLICAKLAGLLGILLALPLASLLNVMLRYLTRQENLAQPATDVSLVNDAAIEEAPAG